MTLSSKRVAILSVLGVIVLAAAVIFLTRPPARETCFDRLGGPGPNSNTSRLDTILDVPADQWPAVGQILRQFATERGWLLDAGGAASDPAYAAIDLCDQVTIVRASNQYSGESRRIGFGIIHMNYEGPGNDAWRPIYRDLHRRFEARWPGRLRYIEGEFGRPVTRPDWLGPVEADPPSTNAAADQGP